MKLHTKVIGLVMVFLILAISFAEPLKQVDLSPLEEAFIKDHPVIYYSPDKAYPPFEFLDESGHYRGIGLDYIREIEKLTGLKFEIVEFDQWSDALQAVKDKSLDVIMATQTDKRSKNMIFTTPIIDVSGVIITRTSQKNLKLEDLNDMSVALVKGWVSNDVVREAAPQATIINFDTPEQVLQAVSLGQVEATLINLGTASYYIEKSRIQNLKVASQPVQTYYLTLAMRDDYGLLKSILDKALFVMPTDLKGQIVDKWITFDDQPFYTTALFRLILTLIGAVVLAMWVWIIGLRRAVNQKTKDLQATLKHSQNMAQDLKKANDQLKLSKSTLISIINHVPHVIFIKNYEGVFVLVNKAMAAYYDKVPKDLVGTMHEDLMLKSQSARSDFFVARDRQVIDSHQDMVIPQETFTRLNGDKRIFTVYKTPIDIQGEDKVCALTVGVDITEEHLAKVELENKQQALVDAEIKLSDLDKKATLGSMVGGITHEINNPIGICVTTLSHVEQVFKDFKAKYDQSEVTKEDLKDFIETYEEGYAILDINLTRAVDMIQSFKRMSVDQLSEARSSFSLLETLEHVKLSLKHNLKKGNHHLHIHYRFNDLLDSYPGAYSQIFTNLIMNSLIHGFEDVKEGNITIDITSNEDRLVMIYKDDGIGMTQDHLNKVFQPYFTTKREQGGSGLGMQIIYNIVVRTLKGTITFESEPQKGVTCTMTLPLNLDA